MKKITLVWFRQDLRIEDNPALARACEEGDIIPVFIWTPEEEGKWAPGAASRWWLHHSLDCLSKELAKWGVPLILRRGKAAEILPQLVKETKAQKVYWNRRYEPQIIRRDALLKTALSDMGVQAESFAASLLFEPWTIANKQGKPFQVFTPFWKNCLLQSSPLPPQPIPKLHPYNHAVKTEELSTLGLLPFISWDSGLKNTWNPGCITAKQVLQRFLQAHLVEYSTERDRPDREGVSRLAPYLHFGEISPQTIWHHVMKHFPHGEGECFLRQLGWREFAHHLLYHFPRTTDHPLQDQFSAFPWKQDPKALKCWQRGQTGYPIVDAGMRQLWTTGWMHNRVRMIVGSFLVKDLLLSWEEGARWFWDTLVDADLANNTLGWQWVGGCGADAAPYFRVFNPLLQGEKFDPDGDYVRQWVPELASLASKWIHRPWEAPPLLLQQAGVCLGKTYPYPIVDHAKARDRALAAWTAIRS